MSKKKLLFKSLINLSGDSTGKVLYKLKRARAVRIFLSDLGLLNRVKPIRLSDLMLRGRSLPNQLTGRLLIAQRLFIKYLGWRCGSTKSFYKYFHFTSGRLRGDRSDGLVRLLICRLNYILFSLKFFESVIDSKNYIKRFGILINDKLVFDTNRVLKPLDIFSFNKVHRAFFKFKFLSLFSADKRFALFNANSARLFYYVRSFGSLLFGLKFPFLSIIRANTRLCLITYQNRLKFNKRKHYTNCVSGIQPSLSIIFDRSLNYGLETTSCVLYAIRHKLFGGFLMDRFLGSINQTLKTLPRNKFDLLKRSIKKNKCSFLAFCKGLAFCKVKVTGKGMIKSKSQKFRIFKNTKLRNPSGLWPVWCQLSSPNFNFTKPYFYKIAQSLNFNVSQLGSTIVEEKNSSKKKFFSYRTKSIQNRTRQITKGLLKSLFLERPTYRGRPIVSIYFPNFLPRFIEPSFRRFEFLIRPIELRSLDLQLPYYSSTMLREDLIFSLV